MELQKLLKRMSIDELDDLTTDIRQELTQRLYDMLQARGGTFVFYEEDEYEDNYDAEDLCPAITVDGNSCNMELHIYKITATENSFDMPFFKVYGRLYYSGRWHDEPYFSPTSGEAIDIIKTIINIEQD